MSDYNFKWTPEYHYAVRADGIDFTVNTAKQPNLFRRFLWKTFFGVTWTPLKGKTDG